MSEATNPTLASAFAFALLSVIPKGNLLLIDIRS
jgi:hypothetical protein